MITPLRKIIIAISLLTLGCSYIFAQQSSKIELKMTLEDVIETAHENSLSALIAKHNFLTEYWQFRSYKAQFLPSLNLGGNLGQYNRSIVPVQNSETGEINYVDNDNMKNSLTLSVDQNFALLGGTFSLYTSLNSLNQFSPDKKTTWNSQPINISYSQPIRAFNRLKWEKKIEPKRFEMAKITYLESIENVSLIAVRYFFDLMTSQKELDMAISNMENTNKLYEIAQQRFSIGTITKDDLLQLNLRVLNNEISIKDKELNVKYSMMKLRNFLGFNENAEIVLVLPDISLKISLNFDDVMYNVNNYSSYVINNEIQRLEAEKEVARAKASVGLQAELNAQFGLTQIGGKLGDAYKNPLDQEIVGLSLKLPIMDWGLGKGRVKIAKSKDKVTDIQIEQSQLEKREDILFKVMQFNIQGEQCSISAQADTIAKERYEGVKQRFINGTITVTDLNNAQTEMDNAIVRYLNDLSSYWNYYYNIRKISLYDYINKKRVDADFEMIAGEKL